MALTMKEARQDHRWWAAWAQAARELEWPERGPTGSHENKVRERLAPHVNARALQILQRGELNGECGRAPAKDSGN